MNDPSQYLVHLTSRGPEVSGADGFTGDFKVFMKQPIKDVNKFGLMMYSIPKSLDALNVTNNRFLIRFGFAVGDEVLVPVYLPQMDYYTCFVSQGFDRSGKETQDGATGRNKSRCAFDEVLQTAINWSIVKHFDTILAQQGGNRVADDMIVRMGCVVDFDKATGCYRLVFGYRGRKAVNNAGTVEQAYNGPVLANTGAPSATVLHANVQASANGNYSFRRCNGVIVNNQNNGNRPAAEYQLSSITFENVPLRIQLMLGLAVPDQTFTKTYPANTIVSRGRMLVVNYDLQGAAGHSGMVGCEMTIPPNLDPPSMLYLQLTVPGTRTKVLGQSDERGGWAIPTGANNYRSKFANLPNPIGFDPYQVRKMPALTDINSFNTIWAPGEVNAAGARVGQGVDGPGFNYDPIPIGGVVGGINQLDNFALVGPNLSRMIQFGGTDVFKPKAPHCKFPRGGGIEFCFGNGDRRDSPVFTTAFTDPQFIYTSTENATIQTFDVKLMFGDTSDPVHAVCGHPVQFSLIASP